MIAARTSRQRPQAFSQGAENLARFWDLVHWIAAIRGDLPLPSKGAAYRLALQNAGNRWIIVINTQPAPIMAEVRKGYSPVSIDSHAAHVECNERPLGSVTLRQARIVPQSNIHLGTLVQALETHYTTVSALARGKN